MSISGYIFRGVHRASYDILNAVAATGFKSLNRGHILLYTKHHGGEFINKFIQSNTAAHPYPHSMITSLQSNSSIWENYFVWTGSYDNSLLDRVYNELIDNYGQERANEFTMLTLVLLNHHRVTMLTSDGGYGATYRAEIIQLRLWLRNKIPLGMSQRVAEWEAAFNPPNEARSQR